MAASLDTDASTPQPEEPNGHAFTDTKGRRWVLTLGRVAAREFRFKGLDVNRPVTLQRVSEWLHEDLDSLVEVAYRLAINSQPGVSFDEFTADIGGGDELRNLALAVGNAVIDHFPDAEGRTKLRVEFAKMIHLEV